MWRMSKRKFNVLYTHQKVKKKKVWQDGFLTLAIDKKVGFLLDENGKQLSTVYLHRKEVLYTHQKVKKKKVWQDGFLTLAIDKKVGFLLDENGKQLSTVYLHRKEIENGVDLESDKYLIQVEDEVLGKDLLQQSKLNIQDSSPQVEEFTNACPVPAQCSFRKSRTKFNVPRRAEPKLDQVPKPSNTLKEQENTINEVTIDNIWCSVRSGNVSSVPPILPEKRKFSAAIDSSSGGTNRDTSQLLELLEANTSNKDMPSTFGSAGENISLKSSANGNEVDLEFPSFLDEDFSFKNKESTSEQTGKLVLRFSEVAGKSVAIQNVKGSARKNLPVFSDELNLDIGTLKGQDKENPARCADASSDVDPKTSSYCRTDFELSVVKQCVEYLIANTVELVEHISTYTELSSTVSEVESSNLNFSSASTFHNIVGIVSEDCEEAVLKEYTGSSKFTTSATNICGPIVVSLSSNTSATIGNSNVDFKEKFLNYDDNSNFAMELDLLDSFYDPFKVISLKGDDILRGNEPTKGHEVPSHRADMNTGNYSISDQEIGSSDFCVPVFEVGLSQFDSNQDVLVSAETASNECEVAAENAAFTSENIKNLTTSESLTSSTREKDTGIFCAEKNTACSDTSAISNSERTIDCNLRIQVAYSSAETNVTFSSSKLHNESIIGKPKTVQVLETCQVADSCNEATGSCPDPLRDNKRVLYSGCDSSKAATTEASLSPLKILLKSEKGIENLNEDAFDLCSSQPSNKNFTSSLIVSQENQISQSLKDQKVACFEKGNVPILFSDYSNDDFDDELIQACLDVTSHAKFALTRNFLISHSDSSSENKNHKANSKMIESCGSTKDSETLETCRCAESKNVESYIFQEPIQYRIEKGFPSEAVDGFSDCKENSVTFVKQYKESQSIFSTNSDKKKKSSSRSTPPTVDSTCLKQPTLKDASQDNLRSPFVACKFGNFFTSPGSYFKLDKKHSCVAKNLSKDVSSFRRPKSDFYKENVCYTKPDYLVPSTLLSNEKYCPFSNNSSDSECDSNLASLRKRNKSYLQSNKKSSEEEAILRTGGVFSEIVNKNKNTSKLTPFQSPLKMIQTTVLRSKRPHFLSSQKFCLDPNLCENTTVIVPKGDVDFHSPYLREMRSFMEPASSVTSSFNETSDFSLLNEVSKTLGMDDFNTSFLLECRNNHLYSYRESPPPIFGNTTESFYPAAVCKDSSPLKNYDSVCLPDIHKSGFSKGFEETLSATLDLNNLLNSQKPSSCNLGVDSDKSSEHTASKWDQFRCDDQYAPKRKKRRDRWVENVVQQEEGYEKFYSPAVKVSRRHKDLLQTPNLFCLQHTSNIALENHRYFERDSNFRDSLIEDENVLKFYL